MPSVKKKHKSFPLEQDDTYRNISQRYGFSHQNEELLSEPSLIFAIDLPKRANAKLGCLNGAQMVP